MIEEYFGQLKSHSTINSMIPAASPPAATTPPLELVLASAAQVHHLANPDYQPQLDDYAWEQRPGFPWCMTPYLKHPNVPHRMNPTTLPSPPDWEIHHYDYLIAVVVAGRIDDPDYYTLLALSLMTPAVILEIATNDDPILSQLHLRLFTELVARGEIDLIRGEVESLHYFEVLGLSRHRVNGAELSRLGVRAKQQCHSMMKILGLQPQQPGDVNTSGEINAD